MRFCALRCSCGARGRETAAWRERAFALPFADGLRARSTTWKTRTGRAIKCIVRWAITPPQSECVYPFAFSLVAGLSFYAAL